MEVFKGQPTPEGGEKTPYAIFLEAQPDTIVYRDGHDEPTYYTKQQIRDACKGIELVIEEVYNLLDWQAPDTLVSECTVEYELYKVTDRFTVMQDVHTGTQAHTSLTWTPTASAVRLFMLGKHTSTQSYICM